MNFTKSRAKAALANYSETPEESEEEMEKRKKKKLKKTWIDEVDTDDWSTFEAQNAIGSN